MKFSRELTEKKTRAHFCELGFSFRPLGFSFRPLGFSFRPLGFNFPHVTGKTFFLAAPGL